METNLNSFITKIENINDKLTEDELSALSAGLNDFLESHSKIIESIDNVNNTEDKSQIQDALVSIQIELVNHIIPHIQNLKSPLMRLINSLE